MDMDGVLVQGAALLPGAAAFVQQLRARGIPFLILTNNSRYTTREQVERFPYRPTWMRDSIADVEV